MLQRAVAPAAILVLALLMAACGGSTEERTRDAAPATPTPTQAPAATPRAEPTPATAATPEATPDATQATPDATQATPDATQATPDATQATPDTTQEATSDGPEATPLDIGEHLRERTGLMWEAYNSHDLDKLRVFYEESYWREQEETVASNMRPFRTFGVAIQPEETSPPTEIAPGRWEVRHTGHFPLGSVKMIFIWEESDGAWLLTYAEPE